MARAGGPNLPSRPKHTRTCCMLGRLSSFAAQGNVRAVYWKEGGHLVCFVQSALPSGRLGVRSARGKRSSALAEAALVEDGGGSVRGRCLVVTRTSALGIDPARAPAATRVTFVTPISALVDLHGGSIALRGVLATNSAIARGTVVRGASSPCSARARPAVAARAARTSWTPERKGACVRANGLRTGLG